MKLIKANHDKPHRCNQCHGVADIFYTDTRNKGVRWTETYRCSRGCEVYWWKGYSDYMTWTWFHGPIHHGKERIVQSRAMRRMRRMAYRLHLVRDPY